MAKIQRTFGWIQNPGELSKLRKVVASLCPNTSEHYGNEQDRCL